jgi:hypothetical protein
VPEWTILSLPFNNHHSSILPNFSPFSRHLCHGTPLMSDVPHQQGVVKLDAAVGENRTVIEVGRFDMIHLQGRDAPIRNLQQQAVEDA